MGYTTDFIGSIKLSRKLTHKEALTWLKVRAEIEEKDTSGMGIPESSYLQWVPSESLDSIVWDTEEKFYKFEEWLQWVCDKFLNEWGIFANGEIFYRGEDIDDSGKLIVMDNHVTKTKTNEERRSFVKPLTREKLSEMVLESLE